MTPDYTLVHIVALVVFIMVIVALTALIDWFLGAWEKPAARHGHVVNWCDKNGHKYTAVDGYWLCVHCKSVAYRCDGVPEFPGLIGSAELGHQGQTGRAA